MLSRVRCVARLRLSLYDAHMRTTTKIAAALVAAFGLTLVAAPAQAFDPIEYYADCPGTATYQQFVIRQFSGTSIVVYSIDPNTPKPTTWGLDGYASYRSGTIYYNPIKYRDKMRYLLNGEGNLNFYYHVSCYYN